MPLGFGVGQFGETYFGSGGQLVVVVALQAKKPAVAFEGHAEQINRLELAGKKPGVAFEAAETFTAVLALAGKKPATESHGLAIACGFNTGYWGGIYFGRRPDIAGAVVMLRSKKPTTAMAGAVVAPLLYTGVIAVRSKKPAFQARGSSGRIVYIWPPSRRFLMAS